MKPLYILIIFISSTIFAQNIEQVSRDYLSFSNSKKDNFSVKYGEFKRSPEGVTLELNEGKSDIVKSIKDSKLEVVYQAKSSHQQVRSYILGDAKTGRLFYFNFPHTLTKVQWQKPWKSNKKTNTLQAHLKTMTNLPISKGGK